jgi:signal transduction histidine kinase
MTRRIAWAVVSLVAIALAVTVLPLGFLTAAHDREQFLDASVDQAQSQARALAPRVGWHPTAAQARRALAIIVGADDGLAYGIGDRYLATVGVPPPPAPDVQTDGDGVTAQVEIGGEEYALARVPLTLGRDDGRYVVLVRPMSSVEHQIRQLWIVFALVVAIAVAASIGLSVWLSRWVGRPLSRLEQATHSFGVGTLPHRTELAGPPEVRRLTAAFNTMTGRLDTLVARQRSVIADVAHQLRTPMSALRLRLELIQQDRPHRNTDLEGAIAEVNRMSRLVDGLLAVSRAESTPVEHSRLDLRAQVEERVTAWAALAAERGVELTVEPGAAPRVWAAADHVDQIMDNLLANCFDAEPGPSRIVVRISGDQDDASVAVIDDGPGMSLEARRRAFDRFTTSRADTGGTGLGLAIVEALLNAGGGSITLDERPGGGLIARFRLPLA